MGSTKFVVFHTGVEALKLYKPLMEVSREALAATNPEARYIVLTDMETAPSLEKDFEVEVVAPSGQPLMRQYVMAQLEYEKKAEPGLVVLAATDCVAARDLSDALDHDMAITYRLMGKAMINNVAYVYDHDLAAWFLERALNLMRPELYEFWGDQEAWQDALGPSEEWEILDQLHPERVRRVTIDGRTIHLYPYKSHNYFVKRSGAFNGAARKAYLIHYKGTRKLAMVPSVSWNILGVAPQGVVPRWKETKDGERPVLPMEERRVAVTNELRKARGSAECGSFSLGTEVTGDKS